MMLQATSVEGYPSRCKMCYQVKISNECKVQMNFQRKDYPDDIAILEKKG